MRQESIPSTCDLLHIFFVLAKLPQVIRSTRPICLSGTAEALVADCRDSFFTTPNQKIVWKGGNLSECVNVFSKLINSPLMFFMKIHQQ